jgi:MOSC domain-containing protein YiiM
MLDLSFRFDRWIDRLPRSPRELGRVERCVVRTGPGRRATPEVLELTPGAGVAGDSWLGHEHAVTESEVSLINVHVIRTLCAGDESRTPLSGDNLHVDLDLSEENLPVGTRLKVGREVVLVVSPFPHRPCASFVERFGAVGAKRVARANRRGLRGRGLLCTIERGGTIRQGDGIAVERPGR